MVWIIVFNQPRPWLQVCGRDIKVMGKLHIIILREMGNSKEGGGYKLTSY